MKPVVIIAIAVVCSVVAVLGVLVVLEQVAIMQAQQAYDEYQLQQEELEKINRSMCVELYGNSMSIGGESNPYADCLDYGHEVMMKIERDECKDNEVLLMATNIERQCELRNDLQYLNAIKTVMEISNEDRQIIETEIAEMRNELKKLNQEWDEWEQRMDEYRESDENPTKLPDAFKDLAEKQDPETVIVGDQIKLMKQQALEEYLNSDSSEWYEIYSNCLSTPIKYFEQVHVRGTFCTEIIENAWDQTCDYKSTTCQLLLSDIMNNEPLWSNVQNIHNEKWDSYSKSCKANGGTDYKKCMCDTELISQKWVELCIDMP